VDSKLVALDFGCGDGSLSVELSRIGRITKVVATDFFGDPPPLLHITPKVEYLSMDEFLAQESKHQFDIVVIRHVLEHHPQPQKLVELIATLLRPGGQVLIEVPSFDGLWPKVFRGKYSGWYVPRHLTHFTAKSLVGLFDNRFRTRIHKSHVPILGGSICAGINRRGSNLSFFGLALFPIQILGDSLFGGSSSLMILVEHAED